MKKNLIALVFASSIVSGCAAPIANGARVAVVAAPEVAGTRTTCMSIQRGVAGQVADSRVAEAWPTSNYGAESVAFAGRVGAGARRMLLKFDLDSIPDNARITKATITLHRETCGCSNVTVHRATARWSERDVTWNSFAGAFEDDALLSLPEGVNTEGDFGPVSFDATELVRGWRQGDDPNYGLVLAQEHNNTSFATSEAASVEERPRLDVCFEATP